MKRSRLALSLILAITMILSTSYAAADKEATLKVTAERKAEYVTDDHDKRQVAEDLTEVRTLWKSLSGQDGLLVSDEDKDKDHLGVVITGELPEGVTAEAGYYRFDGSKVYESGEEAVLYALEIKLKDKDGNNYVPEKPIKLRLSGSGIKSAIDADDDVLLYSYEENEEREKALEKASDKKADIYAADVLVLAGKGEKAADKVDADESKDDDALHYAYDKNGFAVKDKKAIEFEYKYGSSLDAKAKGEDAVVDAARFVLSTKKHQDEEKSEDDKSDDAKASDGQGADTAQPAPAAEDTKAEDKKDEEPAEDKKADVPVTGERTLTATDGKTYKVSVSYDSEAGIPDGARLSVKQIKTGSNAYHGYVGDAADALDADARDLDFAHVFDIALVDPETGEHYQPDSDVKVSIELLNERIKESDKVDVVHFKEGPLQKLGLGTGKAEVMPATDDNGIVEFNTDGFSVYVVLKAFKEKTVTASDGKTYQISVDYEADARIPADAELEVTEIPSDNRMYALYFNKTADIIGKLPRHIEYLHAFDIKLVDPETGKKYQPNKDVQVRIKLLKESVNDNVSVVHFDDSWRWHRKDDSLVQKVKCEKVGDEIRFDADSFSVYTITEGSPTCTYEFYLDPEFETPFNFTLEGTDGTRATGNKQILKDGDKLILPERPDDGNYDSFIGWYDGDTEVVFDQPISVTADRTVKIYAKFSNARYAIFHENKIADGSDTVWPVSKTVEVTPSGNTYTINLDNYSPVIEDSSRVFEGWAVTKEDATAGTNAHSGNYNLSGDTHFYPVYSRRVKVSFVTGPQGSGSPYVATAMLDKGQPISAALPNPDPTWTGRVLDGWYYNYDGNTDTYSNRVSGTDAVNEDKVIYAKWNYVPNSRYTVALWIQKTTADPNALFDKNDYDFIESKGRTGSTMSEVTLTDSEVESLFTGQDFSNYDFSFSERKPIEPEGNTIINVYYTRKIFKITIKPIPASSGYSYGGDLISPYYVATDLNITLYGSTSGKPIEQLTDDDTFEIVKQQIGWAATDDKINHNRLATGWTSDGYPIYPVYSDTLRDKIDAFESRRAGDSSPVRTPVGIDRQGDTFYLDSYQLGTATSIFDILWAAELRVAATPVYAYVKKSTASQTHPTIYDGTILNRSSGEIKVAELSGLYGAPIIGRSTDYLYMYHGETTTESVVRWRNISAIQTYNYENIDAKEASVSVSGNTWEFYAADRSNSNFYMEYYKLPSGKKLTELENEINNGNTDNLLWVKSANCNYATNIKLATPNSIINGYGAFVYRAGTGKNRASLVQTQEWQPIYNDNNNLAYESNTDAWFKQNNGTVHDHNRYNDVGNYTGRNNPSIDAPLHLQIIFIPTKQDVVFLPYGISGTQIGLKSYSDNPLNYTTDGTDSDDYKKYNDYLNAVDSEGDPAPRYPDGSHELIEPPIDGQVFAGWYLDETYTKPFDPETTKISKKTYVYGKWEDPWYVVEVDPAGGELNGGTDGSTWFWLQYGDSVEPYNSITRDYIESADGNYKYHKKSYSYYGGTYNWNKDSDVGGKNLNDQNANPRTAIYDTSSDDPTDGKKYRAMESVWQLERWDWEAHDGKGHISGQGENYDFSTPVTSHLRLTAVWKRAGIFTVNYTTDEDRGTIKDFPAGSRWSDLYKDDAKYTEGASVKLTKEATPKKDTEYFAGWRIAGDTTIYQAGDNITIDPRYADEHRVITLVAVYKTIDTTSITYDPNDGTGQLTDLAETLAPGTSQKAGVNKIDSIYLNDKVTLSKGNGFTKGALRVVGWNGNKASAEAGVIKYAVGQKVIVNNIDFATGANTLYPVWGICKVVDKNGSEHIFGSIQSAVDFINTSELITGKTGVVQMLVDYDTSENVSIPSGCKVTLTTADPVPDDPETGVAYYHDTMTGKSDADKGRSVITRAVTGDSLFTSNGEFTLEKVIIDGGNLLETPVTSTADGGLIKIAAGPLTINQNTTLRNSKTSGNGGAISLEGNSTMVMNAGSEINDCFANSDTGLGGSIYCNSTVAGSATNPTVLISGKINGHLNVPKSRLNEAQTGAEYLYNALHGGGIYMNTGSLKLSGAEINDCTANANTANTKQGKGGGIYFGSTGSLVISNTTIGGHKNQNDKTDKFKDKNNKDVNAVNSNAYSGGGLFDVGNGTLSIVNSEFVGCTVNRSGGGMQTSTKIFTISGTEFNSCDADSGNGGAVNIYYSKGTGAVATLENCTVKNCTANQNGGGICTLAGDTILDKVNVNGCVSTKGGGVYAEGNVTLRNETVIQNNKVKVFVPDNGGGMYISDGHLLHLGYVEGAPEGYKEKSRIVNNTQQNKTFSNLRLPELGQHGMNDNCVRVHNDLDPSCKISVINAKQLRTHFGDTDGDYDCLDYGPADERSYNFVSDDGTLYGCYDPQIPDTHNIIWMGIPICKLSVENKDGTGPVQDSIQLYFFDGSPAVFANVRGAFDATVYTDSLFTYDSETGQLVKYTGTDFGTKYYVKMLVTEFIMNESVDSDNFKNKTYTVTTAGDQKTEYALAPKEQVTMEESAYEDYYNYAKVLDPPDCAVLKRGNNTSFTANLFTVKPYVTLTVTNITLDGNGAFIKNADTGGIMQVRTNGKLYITEGTTIRNHYSNSNGAFRIQSGGKVFMDNGICTNNRSAKGGVFYIESGGELNLSGGGIINNLASNAGGGIYILKGGRLNLSGNPNFGGTGVDSDGDLNFDGTNICINNDRNVVMDTDARNGGKQYPNVNVDGTIKKYPRQDIYLDGSDSPLRSITITDNLGSGKGSIWVWADKDTHYKSRMQFAVLADPSLKGITAFRNARKDSQTAPGQTMEKYLSGTKNPEDETHLNVYWGFPVNDQYKVILRKVSKNNNNNNYTPLSGAEFRVFNSQVDEIPGMETSKASGVFFVGELAAGKYYAVEMTAPEGYGNNQNKVFEYEVGDDGQVQLVNSSGTLDDDKYKDIKEKIYPTP